MALEDGTCDCGEPLEEVDRGEGPLYQHEGYCYGCGDWVLCTKTCCEP